MQSVFLASLIGFTIFLASCSSNTTEVRDDVEGQKASNTSYQKNDDHFDKAAYLLNQGGIENVTLAIKELEQSAKQGNSEALYNLGTIYHYGKAGQIDYQKP